MNKAISLRFDSGGSILTYEDGTERIIDQKPVRWLDERCLRNGSTYQGRADAFRALLNVRQKPAVLISEVSGEMWFPTLSARHPECVWIRYDEILDVNAVDAQCAEIIFYSGYRLKTDVNARVIRLQMKRCRAFLEMIHLTQAS